MHRGGRSTARERIWLQVAEGARGARALAVEQRALVQVLLLEEEAVDDHHGRVLRKRQRVEQVALPLAQPHELVSRARKRLCRPPPPHHQFTAPPAAAAEQRHSTEDEERRVGDGGGEVRALRQLQHEEAVRLRGLQLRPGRSFNSVKTNLAVPPSPNFQLPGWHLSGHRRSPKTHECSTF